MLLRRSDYEWANFIGGNCALRMRKGGRNAARIDHKEQGKYEALILRWKTWGSIEPWSLGVFDTPEEAEEVIEQALQPLWEKA
jgi:hypothetical protein